MKYKSAVSIPLDQRQDYAKRVIFDVHELPAGGHMVQEVIIPPHTKQRLHQHLQQTEVFYILEGECCISINGHDIHAKPGDAFICSPGDLHHLWNQSDCDVRVLVFKMNRPHDHEDSVWSEK